jgi:hypothetical protein
VSLGGKTATTDAKGRGTLTMAFTKPGTQSASATLPGAKSAKIRIVVAPAKR